MIQAVIFDRDNTLLMFDKQKIAHFGAKIYAIAPHVPIAAAETLWETWHEAWPRTVEEEPAFWRAFTTHLSQRYTLTEPAIAALCELFEQYHTCFSPFDDANQCLHALHDAGMRLGLLTNFELPSIARTLQHAGINPDLFEVSLSSGTLGTWKPDPRAYRAIARALDLPPSACAFVDDDPLNVAGARAEGMHAFLLDRKRKYRDLSEQIIESLEPLPLALSRAVTVGTLPV